MTYAVVIERASGNFSAYVPDLPGCVATGATEEEVLKEMAKAIRFHIEGLIEDGEPIPPSQSISRTVETELAVA
ncbi:MAG: type II toxin-antitoxin system HicB family antitoxin [Tepidisphaeraceae bacterium]